jgi:hypothetical protein
MVPIRGMFSISCNASSSRGYSAAWFCCPGWDGAVAAGRIPTTNRTTINARASRRLVTLRQRLPLASKKTGAREGESDGAGFVMISLEQETINKEP